MGRIPAVDPDFTKSRLYDAEVRFVQTPLGRWFAINVATALDPLVLRLTGGRSGVFVGARVVTLTVPGRRSGEPRSTPLLYFTEGDDVIVIASSFGRERHPDWYHNVKAHPEVELSARGRRGRYHAQEVADEAERRRLYDRGKHLYDGWNDYERRTAVVGRTIPVFRLRPVG